MIVFFFIVQTSFVMADSPITSTDLSVGYTDTKIVKEAVKSQGLAKVKLIKMLLDKKISIAEKIAAINVLGWGASAKSNVSSIYTALTKARGSENSFTNDDNTVMAYAHAMGDYFDVSKAAEFIKKPIKAGSKSYTTNMIGALILAQIYLDDMTKWCDVYLVCDEVRKDASLVKDMKQETINSIFSYIDLYKDSCSE